MISNVYDVLEVIICKFPKLLGVDKACGEVKAWRLFDLHASFVSPSGFSMLDNAFSAQHAFDHMIVSFCISWM